MKGRMDKGKSKCLIIYGLVLSFTFGFFVCGFTSISTSFWLHLGSRVSLITNQWTPISPQVTDYLSHMIFESAVKDKCPLDPMSKINCHREITSCPKIKPCDPWFIILMLSLMSKLSGLFSDNHSMPLINRHGEIMPHTRINPATARLQIWCSPYRANWVDSFFRQSLKRTPYQQGHHGLYHNWLTTSHYSSSSVV